VRRSVRCFVEFFGLCVWGGGGRASQHSCTSHASRHFRVKCPAKAAMDHAANRTAALHLIAVGQGAGWGPQGPLPDPGLLGHICEKSSSGVRGGAAGGGGGGVAGVGGEGVAPGCGASGARAKRMGFAASYRPWSYRPSAGASGGGADTKPQGSSAPTQQKNKKNRWCCGALGSLPSHPPAAFAAAGSRLLPRLPCH
jgi:hypothetical protein